MVLRCIDLRQRNDLDGVQQMLRKGFGALHAAATS
jgi:hypothetical protein